MNTYGVRFRWVLLTILLTLALCAGVIVGTGWRANAAPNEKTDVEMAQQYCDAVSLVPDSRGIRLASQILLNQVGQDSNHAALIAVYAVTYLCPKYKQLAIDTYRSINGSGQIHEKVS